MIGYMVIQNQIQLRTSSCMVIACIYSAYQVPRPTCFLNFQKWVGEPGYYSASRGPQPTSTSKWGREGNPSTGYHALLLLYLGKWQRRNIETVQIRITCIKIRRRKGCKFKQVRDIQNGKISIYQKVVVLTELDKLLFDSWTFLGVCTFWVTWMWFEGEVEGGVGIKLCY